MSTCQRGKQSSCHVASACLAIHDERCVYQLVTARDAKYSSNAIFARTLCSPYTFFAQPITRTSCQLIDCLLVVSSWPSQYIVCKEGSAQFKCELSVCSSTFARNTYWRALRAKAIVTCALGVSPKLEINLLVNVDAFSSASNTCRRFLSLSLSFARA